MNLFRSEEHARRWPAFQARAEEGFIRLGDLAGFVGTEPRRHRPDPARRVPRPASGA